MSQEIRNICIIAHVDHGKTTLVDHLLKQAGTYQAHQQVEALVMDSEDQERERGITISAKNASFRLGDVKVNIVDTPGHADFGGEVERIMGMVDGTILLVDAAEGPLPQTRFVLQKAIQNNLKIILCINKVDRSEVRNSTMITDTVDKVFDLFVELGASEEQCDFPIVYACAKDGWVTNEDSKIEAILDGTEKSDMKDLYGQIIKLPAPAVQDSSEFSMLISNIQYSGFVGFLAVGRVLSGKIVKNQRIIRHGVDSNQEPKKQHFNVSKMYVFEGIQQKEVTELSSGEIGLIAGCEDYEIGDTLAAEDGKVQDRIAIEKPTMRMIFSVNTTPNSGKEGKAIQSRELHQRLLREVKNNVALQLANTDQSDQYYLLGRGELQFGIIIETMRREGLEFMVGRPSVLMKETDSGKEEPAELLTIDVPEEFSSEVTSLYQQRKGQLVSYENMEQQTAEQRVKLTIKIPTRGVLGTQSIFKTLTRGTGILNSITDGYIPHCGFMAHRRTGSLIADRTGKATAYSLFSIQQRGMLFIGEGHHVYEGMIIGEGAKENDLNVNPCKPKKLTNIRTSSSDGITVLQGIKKMSLEKCLEWIDDDEWIEITPDNVRLRKKILAANQRSVRKEDRG